MQDKASADAEEQRAAHGGHGQDALYRYEFTAVQSGTYFYHSHDHVDRQQSLGLYGAMSSTRRSLIRASWDSDEQ